MKKLTKDEKEAIATRPLSKKNIVRIYLLQMKVEDIILVEPQDWKWKSATPAYLCRRVEERQRGWKFEVERVLPPGAGWIITRVQ
jgi:hypothetical protein